MKNNYLICLLLVLLMSASTSFAQGVFLFHPTITDGMGSDPNHRDEIRLTSYQFGIGRAVSTTAGGRREASAPSFSEISITKNFDKFSTKLLQLATYGAPANGNYEIRFYGLDGGTSVMTLKIELSEVLFSRYSGAGAGDCGSGCPDLSESISINFTRILIKNLKDPSVPVYSWDIARDKP